MSLTNLERKGTTGHDRLGQTKKVIPLPHN